MPKPLTPEEELARLRRVIPRREADIRAIALDVALLKEAALASSPAIRRAEVARALAAVKTLREEIDAAWRRRTDAEKFAAAEACLPRAVAVAAELKRRIFAGALGVDPDRDLAEEAVAWPEDRDLAARTAALRELDAEMRRRRQELRQALPAEVQAAAAEGDTLRSILPAIDRAAAEARQPGTDKQRAGRLEYWAGHEMNRTVWYLGQRLEEWAKTLP